VDENGDEIPDQPGLSDRGWERAHKLAAALSPDSPDPLRLLPEGAENPAQIFVPRYADGSRQHRTYQTMGPLAESLKLVPTDPCCKQDVGRLVEVVLDSAGVVVICWEHDCLVAWLQRFAGRVEVEPRDQGWLPCDWKGSCFDALWLMQREGEDYHFSVLDQALLEGDAGYPRDAPQRV